MSAPTAQQQFVSTWTGPAQAAASQLGLPWQWVLAQWGLESGYGTAAGSTPAAANLAHNNPADLGGPGNWQSYATPAAFVASYVSSVKQDYGPTWAGLSGTGLGIGQVLGATQQAGQSYYGAQTASSYAASLDGALQQLVQLTGMNLPVSLTAAQASALGSSGGAAASVPQTQPFGQDNPFSLLPPGGPNLAGGIQGVSSYGQTVSGSVAGSTAGAASAPVHAGWLASLETWAGHSLALAGTVVLGVVLLVAGLALLALQSKGELESAAFKAVSGVAS